MGSAGDWSLDELMESVINGILVEELCSAEMVVGRCGLGTVKWKCVWGIKVIYPAEGPVLSECGH